MIKQAPGERCYHIFYQLYSDAIKGLKGKVDVNLKQYLFFTILDRLFLTRPIKDYHFVAQAEVTIEGVDDKEEMMITDVRKLKGVINRRVFARKMK